MKPPIAYYNEIDPYAAQWLRNLIAAGHIAPGVVDTRSIEDVTPDELRGYTQCHFFAGIGVWSLALRAAGWPDDRPIWTGSCPCQPFSAAGAGAGFADERHLWPAFHHLIAECRPAVVAGEQVASKAVDPWIDLVQDDLEALGYAVGAVAFPSAGVGAPHIRDRTYWVADADSERHDGEHALLRPEESRRLGAGSVLEAAGSSGAVRLAHPQGDGHERAGKFGEQAGRNGVAHLCAVERMADADNERLDGFDPLLQWEGSRRIAGDSLETDGRGPVAGFWRDSDWLLCRDDRWRPVEPGTFPLAHGASSRVGRLRAYGNAINKEAARVFIECAFPELQRPSVMDLI